jgi:hypothetical protein
MSLNRLLIPNNENLSVNSISIDGTFINTVDAPANNDGLTLVNADPLSDFYVIEPAPVDVGASVLYANQIEMIVRSATYSIDNEPIFFDDFKYSQPSFAVLRNDSKTIVINAQGIYLCYFTMTTSTLSANPLFRLTKNDVGVTGSFMAIPPSPLINAASQQAVSSSSSCMFTVGVGGANIKLEIILDRTTTIISTFSSFSIIKLS